MFGCLSEIDFASRIVFYNQIYCSNMYLIISINVNQN